MLVDVTPPGGCLSDPLVVFLVTRPFLAWHTVSGRRPKRRSQAGLPSPLPRRDHGREDARPFHAVALQRAVEWARPRRCDISRTEVPARSRLNGGIGRQADRCGIAEMAPSMAGNLHGAGCESVGCTKVVGNAGRGASSANAAGYRGAGADDCDRCGPGRCRLRRC